MRLPALPRIGRYARQAVEPYETVIVFDSGTAWKAALPRSELVAHLDHRARRMPESELSRRVGVAALAMLVGGVVGSLVAFVYFMFTPSLSLSLYVLAGFAAGAAAGALPGWHLGGTSRGEPLWVVRRSDGQVVPCLHRMQVVERWRGEIRLVRDERGERLVLPAGVPVQSAQFMYKAIRDPDLKDSLRGGMSPWAKLQITALCVLAGAMVMMVIFFAIATGSPGGVK